MKATRILIVDDHQLFLAGIRDMMSKYEAFEVDIQSDIDTVKLLDLRSYDILLSDLSMPQCNGFELLEYARRQNPAIKVFILSIHDGIGHIQKAKELGANGYLLKEESEEVFIEALSGANRGTFFLSARLRLKLEAIKPSQKMLTPREEEIIKLIIQDKPNSEISSILNISANTVKTHRKNILSKLRASKLDSLHAYAKEYLTI